MGQTSHFVHPLVESIKMYVKQMRIEKQTHTRASSTIQISYREGVMKPQMYHTVC